MVQADTWAVDTPTVVLQAKVLDRLIASAARRVSEAHFCVVAWCGATTRDDNKNNASPGLKLESESLWWSTRSLTQGQKRESLSGKY
jgi:hypothetical protein